MIDVDVHSRSRLAGYEPEILFNTVALIVGIGALGQNLALDLALAGIGEIDIVDFDVFEKHNATRSPLYPTVEEQVLWGMEKAKVTAHKLLPMMTAPNARVRYAVAPMQSLGDLPITHSTLVFAAVDNASARAYLAERCRIIHRPLFEAGFHGEIFNLSAFGPDADEPCYLCLYPEKIGAYSCTRYALQIEAEQAIPAIQNTAAVLAGLQAEAGIQWLHGQRALRNKRIYGDIRTMSMRTVTLTCSSECPGIHRQSINDTPRVLDVQANDSLELLTIAVKNEVGPAYIYLPEPLVMRNFCIKCNRVVEAHAPEWRWLASPLCTDCGGAFVPASEGRYISSRVGIHTDEEDEAMQLMCAEAGLPVGSTFEVWPDSDGSDTTQWYLMQIRGTIDEIMTRMPVSSTL